MPLRGQPVGPLAAPFWFALAGSGITLALIWKQLAHTAHADEEIRTG